MGNVGREGLGRREVLALGRTLWHWPLDDREDLALVLVDEFPVYLLLLLVVRDLMIIGGAGIFFMLTGPFHIAPSRWGKFSTFLHISLLLLIMLGLSLPGHFAQEYRIWLEYLITTGFWLVAVASLISGFTYVWSWKLYLIEAPGWRNQGGQENS